MKQSSQSPLEDLDDHIPILRRKRKFIVHPELVLLSDIERGLGTFLGVGPSLQQAIPDPHKSRSLATRWNVLLDGVSTIGVRLLKRMTFFAEKAHLLDMGSDCKFFEGTTQAF